MLHRGYHRLPLDGALIGTFEYWLNHSCVLCGANNRKCRFSPMIIFLDILQLWLRGWRPLLITRRRSPGKLVAILWLFSTVFSLTSLHCVLFDLSPLCFIWLFSIVFSLTPFHCVFANVFLDVWWEAEGHWDTLATRRREGRRATCKKSQKGGRPCKKRPRAADMEIFWDFSLKTLWKEVEGFEINYLIKQTFYQELNSLSDCTW